MPGTHNKKTTAQDLKNRALELAALPRNQGWVELSQILELLNGHRGKKGRAEFKNIIRDGALSRRTAYYLPKVGQIIRTARLSTSRAQRIGWTKLQIIGGKMNGKNAARLLKLAEENNAQLLKRLVRENSPHQKPHCVLLYFSTEQYHQFKRAVLQHGGSSAGRGLVGKEEAILRIIRRNKLRSARRYFHS
jgi:hypothetical protein